MPPARAGHQPSNVEPSAMALIDVLTKRQVDDFMRTATDEELLTWARELTQRPKRTEQLVAKPQG